MRARFRLALAVASVAAACSSSSTEPDVPDPGIIYSYPLNGQVDVPLGARILVTFSDPVDPSALVPCTVTGSAVSGGFCLVGPDGPVSATAEVAGDDKKTVQFTNPGLVPGASYQVFVTSALAPTAKNLPAGPLVQFTARSTSLRAAAPAIVAVNGGSPTAPDSFRPMFESSTIRLVFSEPLDQRTVALAPGSFELLDGSGTEVPAAVFCDGIHVAIDPEADLIAGQTYQLKIGGAVADLGGAAIEPQTIDLTPTRSGSAQPIIQILRTRQASDPGPSAGHSGAASNTISLVHPLIGTQTAQIQPSTLTAEIGDPTALDGPIEFTIRKGQRLAVSGLSVALGGAVASGLSTGEIQIELLTDAGGRIYRNPYQPTDQRPDNDRSPTVTDLSMDIAIYAVDPTGNAVLSQTVLGVQASGVVTPTEGVLDIEAVIAMDFDLLGIAKAPSNLVLELISDVTAQAAAPDHTPPQVVTSLPPANGELPIDSAPQVVFSEPIDVQAARAGGITLQVAGGDPVPTVLESHGAAVVLRPVTPLQPGTAYEIALSGVTDQAGNALLATDPIQFSTQVFADFAPQSPTPLTLSSVHPGVPCALTPVSASPTSPGRCAAGGANDDPYHPFTLAANEPIEMTFTQPLATASIARGTACNTGSVRVELIDGSGACSAAVAGTLLSHDRALTFWPDEPWQNGQHYRLTLPSSTDGACPTGVLCGADGLTANFDPLNGNTTADAGGPDLVIDFTGAPPTSSSLVVTNTLPFTDSNGSGLIEASEVPTEQNRVALQITGTTGVISSATFDGDDCLPDTPAHDGCMYLSGAMPVEMEPAAQNCQLPDNTMVASCVPVVLSPQAMYATSLRMKAVVVGNALAATADTNRSVLRLREPKGGPITGYLFDDGGTPTLIVTISLYLDAPDLTVSLPATTHNLHSLPLSATLRGPLRFLPDGRISIAASNIADVPLTVSVTTALLPGGIKLLIPAGHMSLQLISPPVRGGLR